MSQDLYLVVLGFGFGITLSLTAAIAAALFERRDG